jgi:hypothetical protein
MKIRLFSLTCLCFGLSGQAGAAGVPRSPEAAPPVSLNAIPAIPAGTPIQREKVSCVDITTSRVLGMEQEATTTQYVELSSERETWKIDTVTWVRTKGRQTEKNSAGVVLQTNDYSSVRSMTSLSRGYLLIERSNTEVTSIDSSGASRTKKYSNENHYVIRGNEKVLIKSMADGVLLPDRTSTQVEHTLGDGRRITSTVEKTPYVTKVSPLSSYLLEVLRSESSCLAEPL